MSDFMLLMKDFYVIKTHRHDNLEINHDPGLSRISESVRIG